MSARGQDPKDQTSQHLLVSIQQTCISVSLGQALSEVLGTLSA